MDLKEYIKSLIRQHLEEDGSTTAGVPGYMTPAAFSKGKGKNKATKQAEEEGWKVTKGETEMPADSKVKDYVSLTGKKKKKVKIYETESFEINDEVEYEGQKWKIINKSGNEVRLQALNPEGKATGETSWVLIPILKRAKSAMNESLNDIIEQELLNEVTYNRFKNEVKYRTKAEQLHKAIREVKRKLQEIDRIVEYTHRMKQELSEGDGIQYWNRTNKAVATISEMINQLNNKIKNLNQ